MKDMPKSGQPASDNLDGRKEVRSNVTIDSFIGCLTSPLDKPASIEDMNDAIAEGWAGKQHGP